MSLLTKKLIKSISNNSDYISELIKEFSIDSILISNDRSFGIESAAIIAAKKANKKINILCFAQVALHIMS